MKTRLHDFTVRERVAGYEDEDGMVGYGGKLGRFYIRGERKYAWSVICRRRKT